MSQKENQEQDREAYKSPLLLPGQRIRYKKELGWGESELISEIDNALIEKLPRHLIYELRYQHPFGDSSAPGLLIPTQEGVIQTSRIKDSGRDENTIFFETRNSTYSLEYIGIDLDELLEQGKTDLNGARARDFDKYRSFPAKSFSAKNTYSGE